LILLSVHVVDSMQVLWSAISTEQHGVSKQDARQLVTQSVDTAAGSLPWPFIAMMTYAGR
jgi:hypothetical protein